MRRLESKYQAELIKELRRRFPGCWIEKGDANAQQGMCDLTIYWGPRWAKLEVKREANSTERPNQAYFVEMFNQMSFAAFIHPDNEKEVLDGLQQAFESSWDPCVSQPKQLSLGELR